MRILCAGAAATLVCVGCSSSDQKRIASPAAVQPEAVDLTKPPQDLVDQQRLMAMIRELPTKRAALGDEESRAGLRKAEELIRQKLEKLGCTPQMQEFKWALPLQGLQGWMPPGSEEDKDKEADAAKRSEHTWHNIIVEIPGKELPNEVVLIGAHFDAVPMAPGADDNGTG